MAKKNIHENAETGVEAISKSEAFLSKNLKKISIIAVLVLVAGVGGYFWYNSVQNKRAEVKENYFAAESLAMTATDSLTVSMAINEMKNLVEEYGERNVTKAVPVYPFEKGILAYEQKNFEEAIKCFEEYDGEDELYRSRALACIGDCYVELGKYSDAITYYANAIALEDNEFASEYAFKAGLAAEKLEDYKKALNYYTRVKEQYPGTPRSYEIDKYIGRVEVK